VEKQVSKFLKLGFIRKDNHATWLSLDTRQMYQYHLSNERQNITNFTKTTPSVWSIWILLGFNHPFVMETHGNRSVYWAPPTARIKYNRKLFLRHQARLENLSAKRKIPNRDIDLQSQLLEYAWLQLKTKVNHATTSIRPL